MGNLTLRDVAKSAGVSVATVSKALNNRKEVHPDTRARVLIAAEMLNFRPDLLGKGKLQTRTGTVGLLTDDLVGRFSLPILTGAENAFGHKKISVFLCDARGDEIRESFHIEALLQKKIDGLIVVGSASNERRSLGKNFPIPVVYAYVPSSDPEDLSIVPDNKASAVLAAEHFLTIGKSKIVHIAGKKDSKATHDRIVGFQEVLTKNGHSFVAPGPLFGDWSESWGRTATHTLLESGQEFDGIFCGNDQIARGCTEVLREQNIDIPGQVAVIGFDNWEVVVTGAKPQITTIDMNLEELGALAAKRLFDAIDGRPGKRLEKITGRLILRGSTMSG
jgi:LacI family transcriptional regulator